ncbi:hypothetical protein DXD24_07320, partial [Collinsella sp. TF12-2AT]
FRYAVVNLRKKLCVTARYTGAWAEKNKVGSRSEAGGHYVCREFRMQRRPLNVAFVLHRTVEQQT